MWALSFNFFTDIPHELLYSCTKHSDLTLDRWGDVIVLNANILEFLLWCSFLTAFHSEKHLFDAIQVWLNATTTKPEGWSNNADSHVIWIDFFSLLLRQYDF